MIIIPINDKEPLNKKPFHIWNVSKNSIDSFRVPPSTKLGTYVSFWQAKHGLVAVGQTISPVYICDRKEDRNYQKQVANVHFLGIFYKTPIYTKEIAKFVNQYPTYIPELLIIPYLHNLVEKDILDDIFNIGLKYAQK